MLYESPRPIDFSAATLLLLLWFWQPPLLPRKILLTVFVLSVPPLQSILNAEARQILAKWRCDHVRPQLRLFMRGWHFQNGSGSTSKNLLLIAPMKAMRTLKKLSNSIIFRILEINQRLETTQRVFIQENWFNRSKNNELYNILTCPVPMPLSPALNRQHHNHSSCETSRLAIIVWGSMSLELPKSSILRELLLFHLYSSSLEKPHLQCLSWIFDLTQCLFSEILYL